jgi:NADPH2:quinone reductase
MKAIRMHQFGGPEVLTYEEIADPIPSSGQALVDIQAVGVNFADVYGRKGASAVDLPTIPGQEASGTIVAIGEGETDLVVGDLVAYCGVRGTYAQMQAVPTNRLIKLPGGADPRTGAAAVLQGMTAHYLVHTTYPLKNGDTCLIHAGAGGVGLLMIQMAKQLGAFVITTVSTKEKMELARGAGADKVINYTLEDFEEETKNVTDGKGVQVAYDSVGRDTFHKSLACVTRRGLLVLFGQASGPVEPVAPQVLNAGSKFLTRPSLVDHMSTRDELDWRAGEVFGWILSGELTLRIVHEFPLAEAAEAHRQLEGRATTGKVVLLP